MNAQSVYFRPLTLIFAGFFCASVALGQQSLPDTVIAIVPETSPAAISFDPPQGRIESASDGAAYATRTILNTPNLGNSWLNAGLGVVEFVLSPVAAGYGAVNSARARLPEDKL